MVDGNSHTTKGFVNRRNYTHVGRTMEPDEKKYVLIIVAALILTGVIYAVIRPQHINQTHKPSPNLETVDLRIWAENNVTIGYTNISYMFYWILNVKTLTQIGDQYFWIDFGDGTLSRVSETREIPVLSCYAYKATGNYTIRIFGYALSVTGKNISASTSLNVTILPFASPSLTISTFKDIYKVNESIPIALTLTNIGSMAVNFSRMNITHDTLDIWIRTPSNLTITEIGQRHSLPGEIVIPPLGPYNETVTITDDMWTFGYRYDFSQTGKYEIYTVYESLWQDRNLWSGKCISNSITFRIIN